MRLSSKLLDEIITEIVGNDVLPLVGALKNKKNVSEFKLAEKLKVEINVVRNMLYRLLKYNLVSFTRKKDKVKGWYIYYWTLKLKGIKKILMDLKKEKLNKLKERLEREKEGNFYLCPNKCTRLNFDQAVDFEFKCPECGHLMNIDENKKKIEEIEREINKLEKEVIALEGKKSKTHK
ncbi:MAG: transcription factor [Candidatus Woesearchaeota archaeon]|nr:transcription factor [Candidatus Woesearchaeota archaeon]